MFTLELIVILSRENLFRISYNPDPEIIVFKEIYVCRT